METINVPQNTTALDVAFNLSGSLTGFPAVLAQLPPDDRIGFATLPTPWQDAPDIGQTWTPDIQGMSLLLDVSAINKGRGTLNERAVAKSPFTTDLYGLEPVVEYGNAMLELLIKFPRTIPVSRMEVGQAYDVHVGDFWLAIDTDLKMPIAPQGTASYLTFGDTRVIELIAGTDSAFRVRNTINAPYNNWIFMHGASGWYTDREYFVRDGSATLSIANRLMLSTEDTWGFDKLLLVRK